MKPADLGLDDRTVAYWDLDHAVVGEPFDEKIRKEDLAQAELSESLLLDIGWYPHGGAAGGFVVMVVAHQEWSSPIFRESASTTQLLVDATRRALEAAEARRDG